MWYDGDPGKSLEDKVKDACKAYQRAFKEKPNTVYVHPSVTDGFAVGFGPVVVMPQVSCLRHHFFAFREEENNARHST